VGTEKSTLLFDRKRMLNQSAISENHRRTGMLTAISKFRLREGITREEALDDIEESLPAYKGRAGLIRKYIGLDLERGEGRGIYLWESREAAEPFFQFAREMIKKQTGFEPEIEFWETPVIVDNGEDSVWIEGR
jgi:hypothetical protein